MIERLEKILESRNYSDWKIKLREEKGSQLFFVRDKLEISRAVEIEEAEITLYRDSEKEGEKLRGNASAGFHPTMSDGEIGGKLDFLYEAAASAPNRWFPLPEISQSPRSFKGDSDFAGKSPAYWAKTVSDTLFSEKGGETSWINSAEIFLTEVHEILASSAGAEHHYKGFEGLLDLVTTARDGEGREAELHSAYRFSAWEPDELKRIAGEQLAHTEGRINAVPLPSMSCPDVILRGEALEGFFQYWIEAGRGESVFRGIHTTQIGDELFPGKGDSVSLRGLESLRNDPNSRPYDHDGIVMKELEIMKKGCLVNYHTGRQFAHYMKGNASGSFTSFSIGPGKYDIERLYGGKYLEIITFSNFQMDPVSGDFGGEIRLAYWNDGEKKIPVTGGSVTGTLAKSAPSMVMSRNRVRENNILCPEAVRLEGMNLTGADS